MSSTQAAREGSLGGPRVAPTWLAGLATPGGAHRCRSRELACGVSAWPDPATKTPRPAVRRSRLLAAPFPDTRKLFAVISGRGSVSVWDFSLEFFFNYF